MKFLLLLCGIFLLPLQNSAQAQNQIDLNELLSRLDQNHMGAVTDVFNTEELVVLKTYLNEVNGISSVSSNGLGPILEMYGPENQGEDFGFIDANSPGVFTIIGPSGTNDFDGAGAIFPGNDTAHVIDNGGDFFEVNLTSGNYNQVGSVVPPPGESFTGMEFNTVDGRLFAISSDGTTGTSTLSEINPTNMTATPIGNTGLIVPIALAIDGAGNAYTYDIDDDIMYLVNLTNATVSALGSIGFDASFGQGMTYDSVNDRILMTALNNTLLDTQLRSVNTTTGATTLIGQVNPGTITQISWTGISDSGLGIGDNTLSNFAFAPNPANDALNLSTIGTIDNVKIYNVVGQVVMNHDINSNSGKLNITGLKSGVYVLKVSVNGQLGSYRFIKQ